MDIEIIEMEERKCKFILKNSTPAMANALRRTILSDIPKMAIDEVEFSLGNIGSVGKDENHESITPLFDEIIAHRLGMVPVPTDYSLFTFKDKCTCGGEGCPNCMITYSLMKFGPCTVLSGDIVPASDANLKVKDPDIPIVELSAGQSVLIEAHAFMGTAKQHVKWQVANGVGYKYLPIIKINGKVSEPAEVEKQCPAHVLKASKDGITVVNPLGCILCKQCEEFTEGAITVTSDDKNFLFKFETDGSLTAEQVLNKAAEVLKERAEEFKSAVEAF